MSRRKLLRLNFFISIAGIITVLLLVAVFIVQKYPWPVLHTDLSLARESTFLGHWPVPSLDEERQERKKIRRYPKSEQHRRLGIIMRRMEYLNVPIFDFFMDPGVQYLSPELHLGTVASMSQIWPLVPSRRKIGTDDSEYRDLKYVVLPASFGAKCVEGVQMVAGEEMRLNIPSARNRRNVIFSVLPLAPSNVRAWLGQNSWARQFTDSDVNQIHSFVIPVTDPVVTSMRLNIASGNVLIASATVAQWDRSGRLPVQVGNQSRLWKSGVDEVEESDEFSQETQSEDAADDPNVATAEQPAAAAPAAPALPAAPAAPSSAAAGRVKSEQTAAGEKKGKPLDELLDPESVKFNQVVRVEGGKSVALGYNALFIQLDPILNEVFLDKNLLSKLAPRLLEFIGDAQNMRVRMPPAEGGHELFQHTIVRRNAEHIPADLPILTKDLIAGNGVFNLYQEFRNFGYKVVSFAPPAALSMPAALSRANEVPKLDGRWLDSNDWRFVARRRELDQQNEQVSGLEAIFRNEQSASVQAMSDNHFDKLSELLQGLENTSDAIPDWRAHEITVINDKSHYFPRVLDSFQRWIKDNSQTRFFAHLYLQNDDRTLRPTFKDFFKVLKHSKVRAFALPSQTEKLARLVMADRVFGQVIDSLVARRIFHRTVVAVLLPQASENPAKSSARFFLHAPGLAARESESKQVYQFDDVSAALAQIVGVQLSQTDAQGRKIFKGSGFESESPAVAAVAAAAAAVSSPAAVTAANSKAESKAGAAAVTASAVQPASASASGESAPEKQYVSKFRLIVLPRAAGCQPFEWLASSPYFGLTYSQPIVEEPNPRGRTIRVFPCSLRDQVIELSWFQSHAGHAGESVISDQVSQWLGGTFRMNSVTNEGGGTDSPLFLVGPKAMRFDSLPLRLRKFNAEEISNLFDLTRHMHTERESFARILNLSSQFRNDRSSARTVVYFFREPVLR
ncbi:MAG: hypothetical protein EBR09_00385 [Proteobacteria bacterium]|nr:hypothetical protein [Pseudomonadota bacterium]